MDCFSNYYGATHPAKVVFDINRAWCTKLPALSQLFPEARVICCARNIGWIMDSIERLVRRDAFELTGMFGFEPGFTLYSRVNRLASGDGLVGYALDALREGFFSEEASRMIVVEYQALTRAPRDTMLHLYTMPGEPCFEHDFENVEYQADDLDVALGARGMHTVRRRVEHIDRRSVLPPGLFERFRATCSGGRWRRISNRCRSSGSAVKCRDIDRARAIDVLDGGVLLQCSALSADGFRSDRCPSYQAAIWNSPRMK